MLRNLSSGSTVVVCWHLGPSPESVLNAVRGKPAIASADVRASSADWPALLRWVSACRADFVTGRVPAPLVQLDISASLMPASVNYETADDVKVLTFTPSGRPPARPPALCR